MKGFRDFLLRGNVVDLAVAFVIGGAFAAVVTSFVTNVLLPLLGLVGVPDFATLTFQAGSATVSYGLFLNALIAFVLIAAAIYVALVVPMQRMHRGETDSPAPSTKACPFCATDIPIAATRCPNCTSQLS
jgi:large conductance mechanosensitive channel